MLCIPRFSYNGCPPNDQPSYKLFYILTLIPYCCGLIIYTIIEVLSITKENYKSLNISRLLRFSILLFIILSIIFHISLLNPEPMLGWIATGMIYNWYCLIMFLTMMLLVRWWISISLKLMKLKSSESLSYRIVRWFIIADWLLVAIGIVTTDIIMAVNSNVINEMIIIQANFWALACISLSVVFLISGRKIISDVNNSIKVNPQGNTRVMLFKFKAIYWTFLLLGVPFAAFHEVSVFTSGIVSWMICYSMFNSAGIIIFGVMLIILGIKNKPEVRPSKSTESESDTGEG